ncbi:hypothetical protein PC9H_009151 [Pleurotus ostreatus]|uniref:Uncharacterized protein n=1 Tax=Pleurotus ostreatus TaxID=5322 RepID=A0A8H7DR87_PLEOS|nr:uncharacterized protein PC9H_009151 [Pleurotus ostreatus]KAF7426782.1 hypothetical protein PC9H_009151 [Pleurotus ostreatus]
MSMSLRGRRQSRPAIILCYEVVVSSAAFVKPRLPDRVRSYASGSTSTTSRHDPEYTSRPLIPPIRCCADNAGPASTAHRTPTEGSDCLVGPLACCQLGNSAATPEPAGPSSSRSDGKTANARNASPAAFDANLKEQALVQLVVQRAPASGDTVGVVWRQLEEMIAERVRRLT